MQLVITEKPSVAQSIAAVIGAKQRRDGYMEGAGHIVSWCVGHLVELVQPESYDERYAKWKREDLPILPEYWKYAVPKNKEKQLKVLRGLMAREDVDGIACATDAGREGELIFRLVYAYCGCKKPVQRLWLSSMEESAITEGFRTLKSSAAYDNLYQSGLCRSQADWAGVVEPMSLESFFRVSDWPRFIHAKQHFSAPEVTRKSCFSSRAIWVTRCFIRPLAESA